jgi:hypothetical protein
MEEISTETNTGVESAQAADVQSQENVGGSGVESPDVAGQIKDEKDFSSAFKAREAQVRQQIEQEYSTKLTESQSQVKYLERQAKISGYDNVTDYMKALDEYERQQEIKTEAAKYGVPEDFIRGELKPLKDEIQQLRQEREQNQAQEQTRQLQTELDKVRAANPDFDNYFEPVRELFAKGYSLADAYRLASYEDKLSSIGQQKEQEVLANVTNRDSKQVLPSKDKPNNLAHTPSNMSFADIAEISKRVQAGEKIKF